MWIPRLAPPAALFLAACVAPAPTNGELVAEIEARYRSELRAFEAEKARFARTVDLEAPLVFGEAGELYLRDVELIGWPGSTFLRVEYTYLHTGSRTRVAPVVELGVMDPSTGDERWITQELGVTFGIELGTGSTYTTWMEIPTDGLHRRAGWTAISQVQPARR